MDIKKCIEKYSNVQVDHFSILVIQTVVQVITSVTGVCSGVCVCVGWGGGGVRGLVSASRVQ